MISPTGYMQPIDNVPVGGNGGVSYTYQPLSPMSPYSNMAHFGIPNVEYIPHRVFVGGFTSVTKEEDLHAFFQQFGNIREVKVIKSTNGVSKGYGFVTFETEEEANNVRNMDPQKLQIRGRRLNLGPALRRLGAPRYGMTAGYEDFGATTSPYWSMGYAFAYPNSPPPFYVVSPTQMVFPTTTAVSPPTSPTAASSMPNTTGSSSNGGTPPEFMTAAADGNGGSAPAAMFANVPY